MTVLSYASPYPPGHPFSRADIRWMAYVEKASRGRLKIQPFWAGALLSSDQSMAEVRHGVADIGLITPIYARGGAHTSARNRVSTAASARSRSKSRSTAASPRFFRN